MTIKKKKEMTINDLAVMIGKGFNEMGERINVVSEKIEFLKESNEREHREMIKSNTREHEELKLRQDEVPYRFEFVELEKRVNRLERRSLVK